MAPGLDHNLTPLNNLLYIPHIYNELLQIEVTANALLYTTWLAWRKICTHCMLNSHTYLFFSLWNNLNFPMSIRLPTFIWWYLEGLCYIHFLVNTDATPFQCSHGEIPIFNQQSIPLPKSKILKLPLLQKLSWKDEENSVDTLLNYPNPFKKAFSTQFNVIL